MKQMKEKVTYELRKEGQLSLFTSNKELLYPRIKEIARYGDRIRESPRRLIPLTNSLTDIASELEAMINISGLKYKYMLVNGNDFHTKDYCLGSLLTLIWKYCEPLDTESIATVYEELENIECWTKETWAELLLIVSGEE